VDPARHNAVVALGQIGDPSAIEAVMSALDDHESHVRQAAVETLVAIGPDCVPGLINKLEYFKSESTQQAAVTVLGRIGDKRAILYLVNRLGSTFFAVRAAVVLALTSIGEEAIPFLTRVLTLFDLDLTSLIDLARHHPAVRLRLRAIRALGELKHSQAREALHQLMEDPEPVIRHTAQEALSMIGLAKWARISALKVLGGIGAPACVEPLSMALRDPHPDVRFQAVRSLSHIRDPRTAPLLAGQLKDESERHRAAAVVAIGRCKEVGPEIPKQIVGLLKDPERSVRHEAARVLGWLACPEAIDGLVDALSDGAWRVVECAEISLSNYGEEAAAKVTPLLKSSQPESLRLSAVRVLGRIDSAASRTALESVQDDAVPEISKAAHEALKNLDRM
jgi:HEAT repeat protein